MATVYDTLSSWARKTTSSFGEFLQLPAQFHETLDDDDTHAYRLKHWPDLPSIVRTAGVLRTLSMMSHRPVNRRWILATSRLKGADVDRLLAILVRQDAVLVTDTSIFPAGFPAATGKSMRHAAAAARL